MFGLPVANEAFVSLTILSGIIAIVALGNFFASFFQYETTRFSDFKTLKSNYT